MQLVGVKCAYVRSKEEVMEHIGHNIRRMRDAANMSQQKLAEMAGISKSQLSRLESGEQDNPSIKTLIPIAAALGASIEEIVYGESSKTMDFMTKAIDDLPDEDRAALRKLIRGWVLISHNEKMDE